MNCLNAEILKGLQDRILSTVSPQDISEKINTVFKVDPLKKHEVIKIAGTRTQNNLIEYDLYNYYPLIKEKNTDGNEIIVAYNGETQGTNNCQNYDPFYTKTFMCGDLYKLYSVRARLYMIFLYSNCVNDVFNKSMTRLFSEYSSSFTDANKENIKKLTEIGELIKKIQGNHNPFLTENDYLKTLPKIGAHVCTSQTGLHIPISKLCNGHIKLNTMLAHGNPVWPNFTNASIFNNLVLPIYSKVTNYLQNLPPNYTNYYNNQQIKNYISHLNYFYEPYKDYFVKYGIYPRQVTQSWMPQYRFINSAYDDKLLRFMQYNQ